MKKILLPICLAGVLLGSCNSLVFNDVSIVRCYSDEKTIAMTYKNETGTFYITLYEDELVVLPLNLKAGYCVGTLKYKITYGISEDFKVLNQSISYSNIKYTERVNCIGKDTKWADYVISGIPSLNTGYHTFKMPKDGESLSYDKQIDISEYHHVLFE